MSKSKTEKNEKKSIDLEDYLETEKKITNNQYEKDITLNYKNELLTFHIKVITQKAFEKIGNKIKKGDLAGNRKILESFLINRKTEKPFTTEAIEMFEAGLVNTIAEVIMEESGFNLNKMKQEALRGF